MSTLIPVGFDNITVLRGSKYIGVWDWEDCDFTGMTATVKIKNIHPDFADVKNVYEVGTVTVCPLDIDGNPYTNRIQIELSKEDTLKFAIPDEEEFSFDDESGYYSILNITLDDGTVVLTANVKVVNSLEAETLNFLLDEKDEAIIINQKLDSLVSFNAEFITQRDAYLQTLSDAQANIDMQVEDITTKHGEINQIKDDVIALKGQVETIFDNFDDRYLGAFATNPTLDNDGNALAIGAIYLNSTVKELRFYNGATWDSPVAAAQTYAQQASSSATSAANSATSASSSATSASSSATSATSSKNAAATSATNAANSATNAANSATSAANSATSAANSATSAANSATSAATSATNAANSAITATNKANEASASATSANTSKLAAKQSEDNAKASEDNALAYSQQAEAYRDEINPDIFLKKIRMCEILSITNSIGA